MPSCLDFVSVDVLTEKGVIHEGLFGYSGSVGLLGHDRPSGSGLGLQTQPTC